MRLAVVLSCGCLVVVLWFSFLVLWLSCLCLIIIYSHTIIRSMDETISASGFLVKRSTPFPSLSCGCLVLWLSLSLYLPSSSPSSSPSSYLVVSCPFLIPLSSASGFLVKKTPLTHPCVVLLSCLVSSRFAFVLTCLVLICLLLTLFLPGQWLKKWRKRHFTLEHSTLSFAAKEGVRCQIQQGQRQGIEATYTPTFPISK